MIAKVLQYGSAAADDADMPAKTQKAGFGWKLQCQLAGLVWSELAIAGRQDNQLLPERAGVWPVPTWILCAAKLLGWLMNSGEETAVVISAIPLLVASTEKHCALCKSQPMGRGSPVNPYQQGSSQTSAVFVKSTVAVTLLCHQILSEEDHACNQYMLHLCVCSGLGCLLW